jgi:Carboxypeptidase regulatory-like domain
MTTRVLKLFLLVAIAVPIWGQSTNGTISGTVEDASKALIPGVMVTATNVNTGIVSTAITNETGAYNMPALLPGQYKVSAELPGFQTEVRTGVELGNALQLRLNFSLSVAGGQQAVEVSVPVDSLIATSSASVAGVLTEQRVRDLPVVGNNAMDLSTTMPGVVAGFSGTAGQARSEASYETSISGLNVMSGVNVTRDGINNSAAANSNLAGYQAATVMNPDLVGEIRIIVAPVDAEMGRGNAQIQVLTRSGTNTYRGAATYNVQNSALNSKTWQENSTGIPPSAQPGWFNTQQYTLSYGGAIKKNKTFFFVLWDQVLDWQRSTVVSPVLTPCARNGIFQFFDNYINGNAAIPNSSTQARSVDAAGNPVTNLGPLRYASVFGQLPGNLPAANADCSNLSSAVTKGTAWDPNRTDFDSTGYVKKLVNPDFMPLPNRWDVGDGLNTAGYGWVRRVRGNGDLGGVSFQGTDQLNRRQINGKVDHNFNAKNKVAVAYTYEYTYSEGQNVQTGLQLYPHSAPASQAYRRPNVLTVNFTSTLSSNLVNEARMGLRRTANESAPQPTSGFQDFFLNVNGYSVLPRLGSGTAFSGTSAMPFQNAVLNYLTPSRNIAPFWTYGDTLSWTKGKHSLKFGAELRRNGLTISDNGQSSNAMPIATGRTETDTLFLSVTGITSSNAFVAGTPSVLAGAAATGNVLAMRQMLSFLAGSVGNITQNFYLNSSTDPKWLDIKSSPYRVRTTRENEYNFFAKDDWKVRRDLTLNLGVRWDYYGVPWEAHGMTAGLVGGASAAFGYSGRSFSDWMMPGQRGDLTAFEFIGPNSPHPDRTLFPKDWNNFGPAVGFAWQPRWLGEGKTAVRGGYQITYQTRTTLGAAAVPEPATTSWSGTQSDNTGRPAYLDLARLQSSGSSLVPDFIPVSPDRPLQPIPLTRSQALSVFDPNLTTPYVQNLTLSVTRSLSSNFTLDVRYVGTLARKQFFGTLFNLDIPNFRSNGLKQAFDAVRAGGESDLLNSIFKGQTVGTQVFNGSNAGALIRTNTSFANNLANGNYAGVAGSLNTLSTNACSANPSVVGQGGGVLRCNSFPENFIVANPQFSNVTYQTNLGRNNYHSLQAQFSMRPTHGVGFQATYTWSKNLGIQNCCTGPANGGQSGNYVALTDPLNRKLDYTLTGDDRTHVLQTNGTFDLPIGPQKLLLGKSSGPLARVTEGWRLGWIFNVVSGPALDIQAANMLYANGVPDIVGPFPFNKAGVRWGQDAGTYTGGNYFPTDALKIAKDPQCANTSLVAASLAANCNLAAVYDAKTGQPLLVHPLPGNQGTLGRRVLRGVNVPAFDMNATKSFRISEKKNIQLRVDASNVLNHSVPNTPQLSLAPSAATNALNTTFGQIINATGFSTIGAKTGYRKVQGTLRFNF